MLANAGTPNPMAGHQGRFGWSEITSFLNALRHSQKALCIAPSVSSSSEGFINASPPQAENCSKTNCAMIAVLYEHPGPGADA